MMNRVCILILNITIVPTALGAWVKRLTQLNQARICLYLRISILYGMSLR